MRAACVTAQKLGILTVLSRVFWFDVLVIRNREPGHSINSIHGLLQALPKTLMNTLMIDNPVTFSFFNCLKLRLKVPPTPVQVVSVGADTTPTTSCKSHLCKLAILIETSIQSATHTDET